MSDIDHEPAPADPALGGAAPVDLDSIERDLAAVEGALAQLDDGSYGVCQVCQGPIADDVLAADPTARRCAGHPV